MFVYLQPALYTYPAHSETEDAVETVDDGNQLVSSLSIITPLLFLFFLLLPRRLCTGKKQREQADKNRHHAAQRVEAELPGG